MTFTPLKTIISYCFPLIQIPKFSMQIKCILLYLSSFNCINFDVTISWVLYNRLYSIQTIFILSISQTWWHYSFISFLLYFLYLFYCFSWENFITLIHWIFFKWVVQLIGRQKFNIWVCVYRFSFTFQLLVFLW